MSERRDVVGLGVTSITSALWVSALGLLMPALVVVVAWMLTPQQNGIGADLTSSLRFGAAVWVMAHLVPVVTGIGVFSLFSLLLLGVPALLLTRASRKASRELEIGDAREAVLLTTGMCVAHATMITGVSALASSDGMRFRPLQTFFISMLVAFIFVARPAFQESGAWDDLRDVLPKWFRSGFRGAVVSLASLAAISSALLLVAVVIRRADIAAVSNSLGEGVVAQTSLVLLSIVYLPNLWGWTIAAMTGAGTHVGAGAVLALGAGTPNTLPPFPVLAVLPDVVPSWTQGLPIVIAASALLGVLMAWRSLKARDMRSAAVVVGLTTLALAFIALMSGGSLGDGNLADLGPHALHAMGLGFAELLVGACVPVAVHLIRARNT